MTKKDWECKTCGSLMIVSVNKQYMVCPALTCDANLKYRLRADDLPIAVAVTCRRFILPATEEYGPGYWEYVPRKHEGALFRSPGHGRIVARVRVSGKYQVRVLKAAQPPKSQNDRVIAKWAYAEMMLENVNKEAGELTSPRIDNWSRSTQSCESAPE